MNLWNEILPSVLDRLPLGELAVLPKGKAEHHHNQNCDSTMAEVSLDHFFAAPGIIIRHENRPLCRCGRQLPTLREFISRDKTAIDIRFCKSG